MRKLLGVWTPQPGVAAVLRGLTFAGAEKKSRGQPPVFLSIVFNPGAWSIGRSLAELGLERFQVTVSVIRRRGIRAVSPSPDARLEAGDVVVLLGVPDGLAAGEGRLLKG